MNKHLGGFGSALLLAAVAGCSAEAAESGGTVAAQENTASAKGTYYIVTHVDMRKCVSPICGGWFVKRVNHARTKCAGGTLRPKCHVFDLDVSAIGLSQEEEQKFELAWGASHALVRGSLRKVENGNFDIDALHATEAWAGVAGSPAKGRFYGVTDSGVVCITFPCPSFTEAKLNTAKIRNIHGVDLAAPGATEDEVNAGYAELFATGVLVAGKHTTITGPAGKGTALVASEFYSRVLPAASKCDPTLICTQVLTCFDGQIYPTGCGPANCDTPIGPCEGSGTACGTNTCGKGQFCCNESCGICAPKGGVCTQQFCGRTE